MKIPEKFDDFRGFSSFFYWEASGIDDICRVIVDRRASGRVWVADVVGVERNLTQGFGENAGNDVADFIEVASEGAVEVVACNVTQGFGENGGNGESDFREVALEGAVEGMVCIMGSSLGESGRDR